MEPDHLGEVVQGQEEVLVVAEGVAVGWGEHAPGPDPVEVVSALVAEPRFPIKREFPAII